MDFQDYNNIGRNVFTKFIAIVDATADQSETITILIKGVSQGTIAHLMNLLTDESRQEIANAVNMHPSIENLQAFVNKFTPSEIREAYVKAMTEGLKRMRDTYSNATDSQKEQMDEIIKNIDLNF